MRKIEKSAKMSETRRGERRENQNEERVEKGAVEGKEGGRSREGTRRRRIGEMEGRETNTKGEKVGERWRPLWEEETNS